MRVLIRLLLLKLRSMLRSFIRSPGKIIITVIAVGLLGFVVWSGSMARGEFALRDRAELYGLIKVFYIAMFLLVAYSGLSKGATFFSMADVNLLFTSPTSPIKILLYGLAQQLMTSIMMAVFLLYQYTTLHGQYGVSMGELLFILLGYGLTVFTSNITAMTIYAVSSASERRRTVARRAFYCVAVLLMLPVAVRIVSALIAKEEMAPALISASKVITLDIFPFAGWLAFMVSKLMNGGMAGLLGLAGAAAGVGGLILFLTKAQPDYYEDVLQATEYAQSKKTAAREGRVDTNRANVKVKKSDGKLKGMGARAFAAKQRIEENRNRVLLFSPMSWILMCTMIVLAFFMRSVEDEVRIIVLMGVGVYMQLIASSFERWGRELMMLYVYLVPEPPFQKLLAILTQVFRKEIIESIVTWAACGLIMSLAPWMIIVLVVLRMTITLLFIGVALTVDRLWSHLVVKWLQMTLYFLMIILLLAPGVTLGIVLSLRGVILINPAGTVLFSMLAATLPISFLLLYNSRNILENAELNQS
jgi:hypothetical protein